MASRRRSYLHDRVLRYDYGLLPAAAVYSSGDQPRQAMEERS